MRRELKPTNYFLDRWEAGAQLAARLAAYRGARPLVLGIPRGGVPVAAEVARSLDGTLDIIVARKIEAPDNPELALGAVAADGTLFLNDEEVRVLRVTEAELKVAIAEAVAEAERRERLYRRYRPPVSPSGRVTIVVDDGLATGATMRAALRSVRQRKPAKLIVGVPVAATAARWEVAPDADQVECVFQPDPFVAVGLHYQYFEQVSDATVMQLLVESEVAAA